MSEKSVSPFWNIRVYVRHRAGESPKVMEVPLVNRSWDHVQEMSDTRCSGRQEVLEAGGWVWGSRSSMRTSELGRITVSIPSTYFSFQLSGYRKSPLHDHYTRIIILWAACLWGFCQGWPKPRLLMGTQLLNLSDTQCCPILLPAWGRKKIISHRLCSQQARGC